MPECKGLWYHQRPLLIQLQTTTQGILLYYIELPNIWNNLSLDHFTPFKALVLSLYFVKAFWLAPLIPYILINEGPPPIWLWHLYNPNITQHTCHYTFSFQTPSHHQAHLRLAIYYWRSVDVLSDDFLSIYGIVVCSLSKL